MIQKKIFTINIAYYDDIKLAGGNTGFDIGREAFTEDGKPFKLIPLPGDA